MYVPERNMLKLIELSISVNLPHVQGECVKLEVYLLLSPECRRMTRISGMIEL
ncbi:hypothetical protein [Paenibacillus chungangensis]|uniref:Uncharacterized protein n=1 Tax=Paenibacillus chungangensis TaxID=696535 RepID=A0ABW3HMP1_9BACL